MTLLSLHPGSIVIGERLINCVVEGTLIALFVSLLFRLRAFRDSATRFAIWFVTLVAILILPFLGSSGAPRFVGTSAPHLSVSAAWLDYALAAWVLISLIGIFRIFIGVTHLRGLRTRARELQGAELPTEARSIVQEFSSRRDVRICVSGEISAPTAVGFIRPAVLIPEWTLSELTSEKLSSVLLHELGHLRRWDDWTNLLQKVLRAIFFFHPAVWWIDARLCLEREMACDDLVVAETKDARGYAECLISLAERSMLRRGVALAVAAVGRVRQMTLRLGRILDQSSRGPASRLALASLSVIGIVAIAASAHLPMLVILQSGPSSSATLAKGEDMLTSLANVELTSAALEHSSAKVIPAVMKISNAPHKANSSPNIVRERAIRAVQPRSAAKARVVRTSLKTANTEGNSIPALLLVIQTFQPEIPEMIFGEPFSTTVVCRSTGSSTCTVTSTGTVRFTVYSSSGVIRSEFVANVI